MGKKERFAFYLTPEKKAILERRFQEDGSRSMTAFIERAVDFYLDYLSDAAQEGNQYAQYTLGKLYLTGKDVARDREQAYRWFWESASQGNEYAQFFLDHFNDNYSPNVLLSATKLLHHMGRIFQDNSIPPCPPGSQRADRKLRQKIRQKKIAMGHKPDDHEEEENMGGMTMGGM